MPRSLFRAIFFFLLLYIASCRRPGPEPADKPPAALAVEPNPSSAYLTPGESMKKIHLPEGYHLQLVASEPDIQEPVAITWDGNGRLYVAEMRSYMQDIDGTGEQLPICRITRLEDTDGDGAMDKHTVFVDSLVLPRMMLVIGDRLVVNETYGYNLDAYRDSDGDGHADEKKRLYHNDQPDNANLEHQRSGLVWNIDNWIYTTTSPARFRYNVSTGMLDADTIYNTNGQWGLAHDDYGRLFFSSAGGENPALDFQQNPSYGRLGIDSELEDNFEAVWPAISAPDVEGGKIRLRADSTLNHFTASCGQTVFRGDRLPAALKGNLFICEPAGRLIRRASVSNRDGIVYLKNAYDHTEFLRSSDLNFRPVNTDTGPDGCLYIVDMYHGIIQEGNWTRAGSYLRPQILRKQLDQHINRGRIYRLVNDALKPGPAPHLLDATNDQLVSFLSHPNGWWRDNAQKLLIIHNDQSVVPALKNIVLHKPGFWEKIAFWKTPAEPIGKVHALWTLEGLHAIDEDLLKAAYADADPEMRKAAVRISETYLKEGSGDVLKSLELLKNDTSADVRIQLALSLRYSKSPEAKAMLDQLAASKKNNVLLSMVVKESLQEEDPALKELRAATAKMDEDDKRLVFAGAAEFSQLCATCHGPEGKGLPTQIAPPLSGSARVNGDKEILVRILLNGLTGPVDDKAYPGSMLSLAANKNDYIAAVASFIRSNLGNHARTIDAEDVQKVRDMVAGREKPWTLKELSAIPVKR